MTKQTEPPEFIELRMGDRTAFVPFDEAVSHSETGAQVVGQALSELQDWNSRYAAFFQRIEDHAAAEIVEVISKVLEATRESTSTGDGLIVDGE